VFPVLLPYLIPKPTTDFSAFLVEIDRFYEAQQDEMRHNEDLEEENEENSAFAFNPNTASAAELRELGLPDRVAKTIINYRNKGGKFRRAEDLKKIYGLTPADYERLAPYLTFGPTTLANNAKIILILILMPLAYFRLIPM
ncbi:MAG: helix-hairpin-helix domain-containing protein, partial [Saprospiraceae bacterium]|nr:helix-hairpin-helix domain-containing protein [Saprospiraceae bacterium]